MKIRNLDILLIIAILFMVACTKEPEANYEEKFEGSVPISLSVPVTRGVPASEGDFTSLRMFIFKSNLAGDEEGELIDNKFLPIEESVNEASFSNILVPVGYINIYFVANEDVAGLTETEMDAITSVAQLKAKYATYTTTSLKNPPFLMYGEFRRVKVASNGLMTIDGNAFPTGGKIEIERTVAKVTLNLECVYADLSIPGTRLQIDEIKIVSLPTSPWLAPKKTYTAEEDDFYDSEAILTGKITTNASGFNTVDGGITFYIPEHIIADAAYKTYISIVGSVNGEVIDSWEITIGDGIATNTQAQLKVSNDKSLLRITRNTHYTFNATFLNVGEANSFEVISSAKPWHPTNIDAPINAPYLNVSTVSVDVSDFKPVQRIYFWTNQKDIILEPTGKKGTTSGVDFILNDIFSGITNLTFDSTTGTGYFDIPAASAWSFNTKYLVYLKAGGLRREIAIQTPTPPVFWAATKWVGTFHRASEVGERIIYAGHTGAWKAEIEDSSGAGAFITLGDKTGIKDANLKTNNPGDAEDYPVVGGSPEISGTGQIAFRIGMKSKYSASHEAPARYGRIKLTWSGGTSYIYVRQGEDPDYLMRPEDAYGNTPGVGGAGNWRPVAVRFSPYNLTDPNMGSGGGNVISYNQLTAVRGSFQSDFVKYPTQAGAFFQWANDNQPRRAYHPVNPTGGITNWQNNYPTTYWSTLAAAHETCPSGYRLSTGSTTDFRRPNDGYTSTVATGNVAGSEMRQSLYLNPESGTDSGSGSTFTKDNSDWGYYADGFFDRRPIVRAAGSGAGNNSIVTGTSNYEIGYIGRLFFNPTNKASIFFPAAGNRKFDDGSLFNAGSGGYYWSSSTSGDGNYYVWYLPFVSNATSMFGVSRSNGFSIRCIR